MTNDVNTLMSRIDEINSKPPHELTDSDIDDLVAYYRRMRSRRAAGEKPEKSLTRKTDINTILNMPVSKPAPTSTIIRRI